MKRNSWNMGTSVVVLFVGGGPIAAQAACSSSTPGSNATVICSGSNISSVQAAAGSTNVGLTIEQRAMGSYAQPGTPTPFVVDSSSSITNRGNLSLSGNGTGVSSRGAVLLGSNNGNTLTNGQEGVISTSGAYNDGMAANGNNNTLANAGQITTTGNNSYGMTAAWGQSNPGAQGNTIINTGTVSTSGNNARAASLLGGGGTVNNSGTLTTSGRDSVAVYMQGNNDTLINRGTIQTTGTASSGGSVDAVVSNTLGSSFTASIVNEAGGAIISNNGIGIRSLNGSTTITNAGLIQGGGGTAIKGGNGNVTLNLQTGSQIIGAADGGAGNNSVKLQGSGTASNAFINFQSLTMEGDAWTWAGTGTLTTALVQSGTLDLTGTLGATTGSVAATVNGGATLQANAANMPLTVTDNGLVRFQQDTLGTYTGVILGAGSVEKAGSGTLTLAPSASGGNLYTGDTLISQGVLAVATDNALGQAAGALTFNGGTLQMGSSFDLASSRSLSITANNGSIDTQSFSTKITQGITGAGALTKLGAGTLTLNGSNSYAGGTNVNAGTMVVGDGTGTAAALSGGGPVRIASGAMLGGYGSVTGDLTNGGTIAAANAVARLATGAVGNFQINGSLTNAGRLQLGGNSVGNTLTVAGNYVGQNGVIALNTYLAGDGAASDRLVINGGNASGSSMLHVTNVNGPGAQTQGDGIQVVQAGNGATTGASAFTLQGGTISAGAYAYYLAKGGASGGSGGSWYLRNTITAKPASDAGTLPGQPDPVTPAEGTPVSIVDAIANARPDNAGLPVYRMEAPLYVEAPSVARKLGQLQIDNFHNRQGEQGLLSENGKMSAAWGRTWGGSSKIAQKGDVQPSFDGTVWGMQAGQDLYADSTADGQRNHYGFFLGFARAFGDVKGFALGQPDLRAGSLQVNSYSIGGYWTHVGPGGWYTDAVAMGSALRVRTQSVSGVNGSSNGGAFTGSLETGLPLALGNGLTLEPQAQLLWQWTSLGRFNDGISDVKWNNGNTFLGRIGARLQWVVRANGIDWKPYLRLNVLRSMGGDDQTTFGASTTLGTPVGQTSGQVGAGLIAEVSKRSSVYATVSYLTQLGGRHQRTVSGNAGVRWTW